MVPRLIRICRIQCWCSLLLFWTGNTVFGQIWFKKLSVVSLSWNLVPRLIRIWRIQWRYSLLLLLTGNTLFGQICSKKLSVVSLSWNLVTRLIRICRIQWCCSLFLLYIANTLHGKRTETKRDYCLWNRDFEIASCRQHNFFILLRWVHLWIVFGHCLKNFE